VRLATVRSRGTVKAIAGEYVSLRVPVALSLKTVDVDAVYVLSPDTFLTNICIVSAQSGDADRELDVDETIVAVCMCVAEG
jgi:hypothetical protein